MIKLKSTILEDTSDPVEYFNNNKFRIAKPFLKWWLKKYEDGKKFDVRYDNPEQWVGKKATVYKVRPGDTSIQMSWPIKYSYAKERASNSFSIFVPFKDIFKLKLLDKV